MSTCFATSPTEGACSSHSRSRARQRRAKTSRVSTMAVVYHPAAKRAADSLVVAGMAVKTLAGAEPYLQAKVEKRHLVRFRARALRPRGGHAPDRFRQLALVQPGKAEARKGLRLTVECVAAAGVPGDAALHAALGPRFDVDGHPQADP